MEIISINELSTGTAAAVLIILSLEIQHRVCTCAATCISIRTMAAPPGSRNAHAELWERFGLGLGFS